MIKPAYTGKSPYIFVSYAHINIDLVSPFIEALQDKYNVWYDEGIYFGNEWEAQIAERLEKCSLFIFLVTSDSIESSNCKDEIYNAREMGKTFINVLMEEFELPGWFNLRYKRFQMCYFYKYENDIERLLYDLERRIPFEIERSVRKEQNNSSNIVENDTNDIEENILEGSEKFFNFETRGSVLVKYQGNVNQVTIPDNITCIGKGAFLNSKELQSVIIPEGVKFIEDEAFKNCSSLKNINFPSSLTRIGDEAFMNCTSFKNISLNNELESIGDFAFRACLSLESINIPNDIKEIGNGLFYNCESLNQISLPYNIKRINKYMFYGCSYLISIDIPDSIESIDEYAFHGCRSLRTFKMPSSIKYISYYAFEDCHSLESIDLYDNEVEICGSAFRNCKSLSIIEGTMNVPYVGDQTFEGCTSLKYFYSNSRYIGNKTFKDCESLRTVIISNKVWNIGAYAFSNLHRITIFYEGTLKEWKKIKKSIFWKKNSYPSVIDSANLSKGLPENGVDYYFADTKISLEEFENTRLTLSSTLDLYFKLMDRLTNEFKEDTIVANNKYITFKYKTDTSNPISDNLLPRFSISVGINNIYILLSNAPIKDHSRLLINSGIGLFRCSRIKIATPFDLDEAIRLIKKSK